MKRNRAAEAFDACLLSFIFISIFIIGLTVRFKVLTGYKYYDLKSTLRESYNLFTHYKLIALVVLVAVTGLLFLYRTLRYKIRIRKDYVLISTLVITASALLSTFLNPVGIAQVWGFYTRTNGLLAYLSVFALLYIISNLRIDEKNMMRLVHGVNFFSILMVGVGCFQFAGLDIFKSAWYKVVYLPGIYRAATVNSDLFRHSASSLFPHFNYYGAYCSVLFALISSFAVKSKSLGNKIVFSIGSAALFVGVLTSVSQGGLITLFIILLLFPVAFLNKDTAKIFGMLYAAYALIAGIMASCFDMLTYKEVSALAYKLVTAKRVLLLSGLGLLAGGAFFLCRKTLVEHKQRLLKFTVIVSVLLIASGFIYFLNNGAGNNKHLFTDRGYVWFHTTQLIKENHLMGYGPDNLYYAFPHESPDAQQYSDGQLFDKPHNMYLQMAFDTGLVGLVGFIYLLVMCLLALVKSSEVEPESMKWVYTRASMLVVIAYMVQGLVNDNHLSIQPILYTVLGVGMAISNKRGILPVSDPGTAGR